MGMWHTTNMACATIQKDPQWGMEMKICGM